MDDDDWLEDTGASGAQGGAADPLVDNEWTRLATRYRDAGYREGITDGKLSTLQQGFDQGFNASVSLSRRLGRIRGRTNALLAYLLKLQTSSSDQGSSDRPSASAVNDAVAHLRDLIRALGAVKRADVLPADTEREAHERDEHEDEDGFELDQNEKRDMEGIELAMAGVAADGASGVEQTTPKREEALLDDLDQRLALIEQIVKALAA